MNRKNFSTRRTLVYGGSAALAVLLVLGSLVFLGLLAHRYHYKWDLTRDRSQSLSAVTRSLLPEVTKPLTMTAFSPSGDADRQKAKDLLENYSYHNRLITYHFVDPDREPLKARQAGYRFPGNILLEYDGRRQMADRPEEEAVSEALRKLLKTERKKLFFLTGHGERSLDSPKASGLSQAKSALLNEGFEVAELNLLTQAAVPKEAAVVIVPAPQKPLFPQEIQALRNYLHQGGRLLFMLEPFQDGGLKEFLAGYGIGLDDGLILDANQVSQALGASAVMPIVVQYGSHRITQDFTNVLTIYPMARPLLLEGKGQEATVMPLAKTTPTSWEKIGRDWLKDGKADFDPKTDKKGPFTLAALADVKLASTDPGKTPPASKSDDKPEEARYTHLVVFGDVDFAANGYFNLSGNGDFFLNTINFLAAEEKQIVIRKPDKQSQPLTLTGLQAWGLFFTSLICLPLLMVAAGINAYVRRRARR